MGENKGIQISKADPLKEFGKDQKWAVVWFIGAVIFGSALVLKLSKTDSNMFKTNASYFDDAAWKDNRMSQTSIGSEARDKRTRGDLATATQQPK